MTETRTHTHTSISFHAVYSLHTNTQNGSLFGCLALSLSQFIVSIDDFAYGKFVMQMNGYCSKLLELVIIVSSMYGVFVFILRFLFLCNTPLFFVSVLLWTFFRSFGPVLIWAESLVLVLVVLLLLLLLLLLVSINNCLSTHADMIVLNQQQPISMHINR